MYFSISDVEELYAGCIHVEAAKELCRKFKNLYSVEENSEEITVSGNGSFMATCIYELKTCKETFNTKEDCLI